LLIYGYGNPGRQDDGVGIVLVEQIEAWVKAEGMTGVVCDANYQLNAEDALAVAAAAAVVFVDATARGPAPFTFKRLTPQQVISFSTHAMAPESVLALADELYGARPPAWLMGIRGQEWEPNAPLTASAQANVAAAGAWLRDWMCSIPPA
jgi:hydrogenase maturation protease